MIAAAQTTTFSSPWDDERVVVAPPTRIPLASGTAAFAIYRIDYPRPNELHPLDDGQITNVVTEALRLLEPGGRIAIITPPTVRRAPWTSLAASVAHAIERAGAIMLAEIVWIKHPVPSPTRHCPGVRTFISPHNPPMDVTSERILIAAKESDSRIPDPITRRRQGLPHKTDLDEQTWQRDTLDVWHAPASEPSGVPDELYARLISLYTYQGELVVDMKCHTGTALLTADRLHRHSLGVDEDHDHVTQARDLITQDQS